MRNSKEAAAKHREEQKVERDKSRKRKAVAKEVANASRATEREEAQRAKDRRLAERAEAQAERVAACDEAACTKAARVAELAAEGNPVGTAGGREVSSSTPSQSWRNGEGRGAPSTCTRKDAVHWTHRLLLPQSTTTALAAAILTVSSTFLAIVNCRACTRSISLCPCILNFSIPSV
jgi:hypothetical protein